MDPCCVSRPKILAALGVLILAAALTGCGETSEPGGEDSAPVAIVAQDERKLLDVYDGIGGDFTLTDHRGERFRLAETHGRIRLLFFGYSMCPDVCPLTLSRVTRIRQLLGDDGDEVMTLFVSVDPERDTPQQLASYLEYFDLGEAVALTGAVDEIDTVVDLFKATYEKEEAGGAAGYLINHTSYLFLLDRGGTVRALISQSDKPEDAAAAIRELLRG